MTGLFGALRHSLKNVADYEAEMTNLRAVCAPAQYGDAERLVARIAGVGVAIPSVVERSAVAAIVRQHVTTHGRVSMGAGECWIVADRLVDGLASFDREIARRAYFRELMIANGHLIPRLHVDGCALQRGESRNCTCPIAARMARTPHRRSSS